MVTKKDKIPFYKIIVALLVPVCIFLLGYYLYVSNYNSKLERGLQSLGIDTSDLSTSQRNEIHQDISKRKFELDLTKQVITDAAKKMEIAYENKTMLQIYDQLLEMTYYKDAEKLLNAQNPIRNITSDQLRQVTAGKTFYNVVKSLGSTQFDGKSIQYVVDNCKHLSIPVHEIYDLCSQTGEQLLAGVTPLSAPLEKSFTCTVNFAENDTLFVDVPQNSAFETATVVFAEDCIIQYLQNNTAADKGAVKSGQTIYVRYSEYSRDADGVTVTAQQVDILS